MPLAVLPLIAFARMSACEFLVTQIPLPLLLMMVLPTIQAVEAPRTTMP
jgi:hypothetical protein